MLLLQNKKLTLILLLVIFNANSVHATKKSKAIQEPIDIKAQYLLLDENKGISKYKGKVLFTQGTLIIKADAITLYHDGEKLIKALIIGSPADIKHQPENEEKVHSQAKKMQYFVTKQKLILEGDAFIDQGDNHFSGEKIEYDTQKKMVTAAGKKINNNNAQQGIDKNKSSNGRIHVIIGPEEDQ